MKRRLPLLLLLLLALLPVSASAVGMVTEAKYDEGKLVLTAYADDDTVTVKNEKPSDIVLLLDTSSTMNTKNTNGEVYLAEVKAAVESFISNVATLETKEMNRIAILSYASTVKGNVALTDASEVQSKLNRNILRVLDGSSNIATALTEAQTQFDDSDPAERNQIVIILYDSSAATTDAARAAAIAAADGLKTSGVELFCVDYAAPDKAQSTFAADLATDHFNKTTDLSASGDFTAALAKIVRQMGGTVYCPDETAELRVTLSDVFTVPSADQIRVRAEECTLFPGATPAGWEERALLTGYDVTVTGQTVTVTGFDYSANAVYKDDLLGLHGSRLVVEIPLTWSKTSGKESILVKDTKAPSGVYFEAGLLEAFKRPSVAFTDGIYTVVHQRVDGTTAETTHRILSGQTDDLTTKVSSRYLYGGLGSGTSFANGENAAKFTPKANATYTIREVPDTYLQPYVYSVWREDDGQKTVTGLCLLTTADGASCRAVGFATGGQKDPEASLCDTVTVKQGSTVTDRLVVTDGALTSDKKRTSTGQIGYHVLDEGEFTRFQTTPLTFRPYWITNDGVRVSGQTVWTCTHRGAGPDTAYASVEIVPQTGASSAKWVGDDG